MFLIFTYSITELAVLIYPDLLFFMVPDRAEREAVHGVLSIGRGVYEICFVCYSRSFWNIKNKVYEINKKG